MVSLSIQTGPASPQRDELDEDEKLKAVVFIRHT
jgi:hypothetical protein